MKKVSLVFALLFICTAVLFNFFINTGGNNVGDATENVYAAETKNYAIYPSNIIENNPTDINKYVHYERNIDIQFPQIYFSNDYSGYDSDLEEQMNKRLFALSIGNDDSFLVGRGIRDIKEYCVDYTITKFDDDAFSIKYYGHLYSISRAKEFCYGITLRVQTGETAEVSDFIFVDEGLIEKLKKGDIKYHSSPQYDEAFVIDTVSEFIENFDFLPNKTSLFFIDEKAVNLILPVTQGNSNYIVLEVPYES